MKKYIIIICILLLGFIGYSGYSKHKEVEVFKNDVVDYLKNKGFTPEDYSTPKYVKKEVMKGLKAESVEIIFNEERNYTYYYIRALDGIKIFYAKNEDNGEEVHTKKEPIK